MTGSEQAGLRIWHQSMTELEGLAEYGKFLKEHAKRILGAQAAVQVNGLRPGTYHGRTPTAALGNAFTYLRAVDQIIDNAIHAERDGFDAFIIGSFSEPLLREIRSAVDIPVVGILESSMLISCSLGARILPVANAPEISFIVRAAVSKHGLDARVLPCASLNPPLHEAELLETSAKNPDAVLEAFRLAARKAISEDGADVIVPAEGVLATLLVKHGMKKIDDVPVLDVFALAWESALMMVRLRRQSGVEVSRAGTYARQDSELVSLMTR